MACTGGTISTLELPTNPDCDCISIKRVQFGANNTLIITLSNGQTYTSGSLTGADGVGIQSLSVNDSYELVVVLTNGETYTSASLQGPQGEPGITGSNVIASLIETTGNSNYAGWTTVNTATLDNTVFTQNEDTVEFYIRCIVDGTVEDVDGQDFRVQIGGQTICPAGPLGKDGPIGMLLTGIITRSDDDKLRATCRVMPLNLTLFGASVSNGEVHWAPAEYVGFDFSNNIDLTIQVFGDKIRNDVFYVTTHKKQ